MSVNFEYANLTKKKIPDNINLVICFQSMKTNTHTQTKTLNDKHENH